MRKGRFYDDGYEFKRVLLCWCVSVWDCCAMRSCIYGKYELFKFLLLLLFSFFFFLFILFLNTSCFCCRAFISVYILRKLTALFNFNFFNFFEKRGHCSKWVFHSSNRVFFIIHRILRGEVE